MTGRLTPKTIWNGAVRDWNYYVYILANVSDTRDLVIYVTKLSGDLQIFVSTSPYIDPSNSSSYQFSQDNVRLDQVVIPNAALVQGPYWILVYTTFNATYSIAATYLTWQELESGIPFNAYGKANATHMYHLALPGYEISHDVLISVTPLRGKAYVYVSNVTNALNIPNADDPTSYIGNSTFPFASTQLIRLQNSLCTPTLKRCTYLILVKCRWWSECRYNILVQPVNQTAWNNATSVLQQTVPQLGYTPWNETYAVPIIPTSHYEFHVASPMATVTLTLTAFTGYPFHGHQPLCISNVGR